MKCGADSSIYRKAYWGVFFGVLSLCHTALIALVGFIYLMMLHGAIQGGKKFPPLEFNVGWLVLYSAALLIIVPSSARAAYLFNRDEDRTLSSEEMLRFNAKWGLKFLLFGNPIIIVPSLLFYAYKGARWALEQTLNI